MTNRYRVKYHVEVVVEADDKADAEAVFFELLDDQAPTVTNNQIIEVEYA